MSEETKRRIIEAGAELIHQRGFNNTGLKDILKAAGVPKGSFYFYFNNKEAFGIELVDHLRSQYRKLSTPVLTDETLTPLQRLKAFFDIFQEHFSSQGFTRGCPIGNLAQEMSDLSTPFREKLMEGMEALSNTIQSMLEQAQKAGEIPADINTAETAIFIVEAWHGAMIRMKTAKSAEPLNICSKLIFEKVLK